MIEGFIPKTVSQKMICDFVCALSKEDGYSEISSRLHRLLLLESDYSVESIETSIFQDL